jgi:hypothetical protein
VTIGQLIKESILVISLTKYRLSNCHLKKNQIVHSMKTKDARASKHSGRVWVMLFSSLTILTTKHVILDINMVFCEL